MIAAFPPPPGPLTVTYSSEPSFNVSWSPPSGLVEGGVGGYVFGVTGEGCGCVSMNVSGGTTSVRCSGWTAAGQTCSFEVRTLSQDCGLSSNSSTTAVTLTGCSNNFKKFLNVHLQSFFQRTICQKLACRTNIQS